MKHYYDGPMEPGQTPCKTCGLTAFAGDHFVNGGVVCDNANGACACGATHTPNERKS
jgi:hypothetical protein